mgnify:CR=1 FL=1
MATDRENPMSDSTQKSAPPSTSSVPARGKRGRVRSTPKGRRVDPAARAEVLALLGDAPRRRDLLIEFLHKIQDRYGCLQARHLVALASELKLAMAEVYEVATFYHHFDVVKEGDTPPPAITVRGCDSIACELAGAHELLEALQSRLGTRVRVKAAPCVGRCETAPVAVVGGRDRAVRVEPSRTSALCDLSWGGAVRRWRRRVDDIRFTLGLGSEWCPVVPAVFKF